MEKKAYKRLPKILKINKVYKKDLKVSVLFNTGEDRILDFQRILKKEWKVTKHDPEFKLLSPTEFAKVKLANHTLSWSNIELSITDLDGKKKKVPFDVGADILYDLSEADERLVFSIGGLFRKARLAANLSQEKVAELAGTSRTYITKLESDKQDIELKTLKKLVEAGLNKHLKISID
jgi:DNA-binding XRE family transcriptional regulator